MRLRRLGDRQCVVDGFNRDASLFQQLATDRSQLDAVRDSHEERFPNFAFELLHLPGEGRLRHEQPRRGEGNLSLFSNRDERPEVTDVDGDGASIPQVTGHKMVSAAGRAYPPAIRRPASPRGWPPAATPSASR